jgi:hypothetical protein
VPASAAAKRPTKLPGPHVKKLGPAPDCAAFEGAVSGFQLGALNGPNRTGFGPHGTTCTWSGQEAGKYAFVVSVAVFGAPSEVGKKLLAAAELGARHANGTPGGLGLIASKSPRRGNYFEGEALYSLEEPDKETDECPRSISEGGEEGGPMTAITAGQSAPSCAGQPGTEGAFLTAYGSPIGKPGTPRAAIEPMILQIQVACQLDALAGGPLTLARIASAVYGGRGY